MTVTDGGTVFITGGAQGIGLGMARAFAGAGMRVALADTAAEPLAAAARELSATTRVETFDLDVRDRDAFARAVDLAEERLGPITVLCNNAGLTRGVPPSQMDYGVWDHVTDVNLGGTVNGIQTVLPRMIARGGPGRIVNTSSGAGLAPNNDYVYTMTKFAVVGLSEALAQQRELTENGIGVTVVCPGVVRTGIVLNSAAVAMGGATMRDDDRLRAAAALFDRHGLSPDIVGAQVLDAVRNDRLYVHTDRIMVERVRQRTDAILAAMPPETERDREYPALIAAAQRQLR
ncbi:NADP-dependent 3-hydroxy acid dehydrogenase YdfG [Murinocardiopsis flavida]|uniref:NADP-dependent 3-hydroxy acid dehydrogenase YdfG n=1 Tax=Murinocardiopsis flavida TaxID=645275 RepID=A0A2P8CWQ8_9ACTN|nr:SDR family oxidoreductase [Murinocardiopsis flavida]PSK89380.1 NADP-dependent 3-hydroxy acid dehydrogenase YdfG [Murinocardiopsis flavida]